MIRIYSRDYMRATIVLLCGLLLPFKTSNAEQARLSPEETLSLLQYLVPRSAVGPSTYGIASGYGLNHGQAFLSGSITNKRELEEERAGERIDGSYAAGIGIGDPSKSLGFEAHLGVLSSTLGDQTEAGNLGFKIHRRTETASGPLGFAVGASNVAPWGDPTAIKTSYYGAASFLTTQSVFPELKPDIMLTGGISTGARNTGEDPGVFFGLGGKITDTSSLSASWAGDEIIVGSVFQPDLRIPVMVSAGIADLTDRNNSQRLILSFSYTFDALKWSKK